MVPDLVKKTKLSGIYDKSTTHTIQSTVFYTRIVSVAISDTKTLSVVCYEACLYDCLLLFHFPTFCPSFQPSVVHTTENLSC
jgi:hypothetical protein